LLEVLNGDHTPFLRFDEVEWSWRIVDPVLKAWETGAPEDYVAGSDGPPVSTASSAPATPGAPFAPALTDRARLYAAGRG
jgi:glucose-6-phosphate 1-dehydrogenase